MPDRRGRAARWTATAAIVAIPSLYSFRFTSFSDAKLAGWALAVLILAALVPDLRHAGRLLLKRFGPLTGLLALALCATALAYALRLTMPDAAPLGRFAVVPDYAFGAAAVFALMLVAAALCAAAFGADRERGLLVALFASGVPVAGLALLQFAGVLGGMFPEFPEYDQRAYSVFGNQDLFGGYLAITLALGFALGLSGRVRPVYAGGGALVMLPALLISGSRSAWLAAAAGCAFGLIQFRPARRILTASAGFAAVLALTTVALAPQATLHRVANSFGEGDIGYRARLWMWDGAARMIAGNAPLGVGLGNFQFQSPEYLGQAIRARGPGGHYFNRLHTLHAHSDYLETLAETGLAGACLVVAFFALLPRVASPAWAGLGAGLVFSLVNTTLHSPPHVMAVLLCAASLPRAGDAAVRDAQSSLPRLRVAWISGALVVCTGVAITVLVPSFLLARAESTVNSGNADATRMAYQQAMRWPGAVYKACQATAILDANAGRFRESERFVNCALRGLDTGNVRYLAGYVAEMQGNLVRAAAEYEACTLRWPDHLRAWEHRLALAPETERDALLDAALPWLKPEAAEGLRALREDLRSEPVPPSAGAVPSA